MATIGILHPGAMGAAVGAALVAGGHDVRWASDGRSAATAARAQAAGLRDAGTTQDVLERCEVVFSICPPDKAALLAAHAPAYTGIYVDANAIAFDTARWVCGQIRAGTYVDGGIIGPPPVQAGTTRLYLSGEQAGAIAALLAGGPLDARVLDGAGAFAASALKMTYSAWSKGTAAMLLAIERTAERAGVREALHAEWGLSQPDLEARLARAQHSAAEKGWRWEGEMREIAATLAGWGEPEGFHLAAAEVFGGYPRPE